MAIRSWFKRSMGLRQAAGAKITAAAPRTAAQELLWDMSNTVRARFIAAKRLEEDDRAITRVTAFTSAYLIVLSAVPYFMTLPEQVENHLNLFAMALAVVILVSSLLQYSSAAVVNAEQHHRSALEINELFRCLEARGSEASAEEVGDLRIKYQQVLQKYSVNHDYVDWLKVKIERSWDFPDLSRGEKRNIRFQILLKRGFPNFALFVVTLFSIGMVLFYALPNEIG